jgi:hypothetical protein
MKITERDNQINHFAREPESMTPVVVCFAIGALGMLGLVVVAAAPWLLLS